MKKKARLSPLWFGTALLSWLILSGPVAGGQSQSLGPVTLLEIRPRIVTPNNDGMNDKIFFEFDTDVTGIPLETNVFDINGAKAGSLSLDPLDQFNLTWNGKDESGNSLPAGIYIYSIKIGKNLATGTVVVAH